MMEFKLRGKSPDGMERYYFKPWYIKAWRYMIWRPVSLLEFCWYFLWWGKEGFKPYHHEFTDEKTGQKFTTNWNRRQVLKHHWDMARSSYCYRVGLMLTFEELKYELKTGKHFTEMYKESAQGESVQGEAAQGSN